MKKILMLFAAAALVLGAASCQKENFQKALAEGQEKIDYSDDPMGVIKVYIKKDDTKMAFEEKKGEDGKDHLYRSWEKDDVIDGCTKVGNVYKSFAYTVSEVGEEEVGESGEKKPYIVLKKTDGETGVPSSESGTEVNFVYAPGAVSFDETTGACSLDLSKQEEGAIPAVMVASGEVGDADEQGVKLTLDFENIAAVMAVGKNCIALKDVNGTDFGEECSIKKIYAVTRILGTLTFDANGKYTLSDPKDSEFLSTTITPKGETFDDNDTVYLASLPYASKNISVGLRTDKGKFIWTSSTSSNVGENAYARVMTKRDFKLLPPNEAMFNGEEYTIEDAFEKAAETDGEANIELIGNATTYETIEFTKNDGRPITLNLKGYNINCKAGKAIYAHTSFTLTDDTETPGTISAGHTAVHNYKNSGDGLSVLTIEEGNLIASGLASNGTGVVYSAGKYSKLEIKGGLIEATDDEGRAINVSNVPNTANPTTAEVSGGKIISKGYAFRLYNSNSEATIKDDAIIISEGNYAPLYSASSSAKITFNNGWVRAEGSAEIVNNSSRADISGGYFNKEVTAASGYKCTNELSDEEKTHDGKTYTHKVVETYEAKIGTKEYKTLALAVADANESENAVTIEILEDCTLTEDATFITNTNGVTLDLAGKTITGNLTVSSLSEDEYTGGKLIIKDTDTKGSGKISATKCAILVQEKGSFELQSGELSTSSKSGESYHTLTGKAESSVSAKNRPSIVVNGGKVTGSSQYGCIQLTYADATINDGEISAVDRDGINTRALYVLAGGKFIIEGGSFYANQCYHSGSSKGNASITINDGYFQSAGIEDSSRILNLANSNTGTIVNGGYFKGTFVNIGSNCTLSLNGGFFNQEIPQNTREVSIDGSKYEFIPNTTGDPEGYSYKVAEKAIPNVVVFADDAPEDLFTFATIVSALDKAKTFNKPTTIKLVQDDTTIEVDEKLDFTHTHAITLDLNGHTLKGNMDYFITTQGELTISDSNENPGTLTVASTCYNVINLTTAGTVNIKKVTVKSGKGYRNTGDLYSTILVVGTSSNHNAVVNISDGAVIGAENIVVKAFCIKYGTVNVSDAKIITGKQTNTYCCFYVQTGAVININEGAVLTNGLGLTTDTDGIIRSASGNSATKVTINDGSYLSGSYIFSHSSDHTEYLGVVTLKGGYFNKDFTSDSGTAKIKYDASKALVKLQESVNKDDLTFDYHVE